MKLRTILGVLTVLVVAIKPLQAQHLETLFYTVDKEVCFQSFKANLGSIDIVAPQTYQLDEHGILWGSVDRRILDLAGKRGIKVMPLVFNPGFDQPSFHRLLLDTSAQQRGIRAMIAACKTYSYAGMQFDFENIHVTDKDRLTAFYRATAKAFHQHGLVISIAVVPRTSDEVGPTSYHKWIYEYWRGAYDYKALADAGDFISLMTYDQHTYRTTPGPVAGMPWMEEVVRFVMKDVPAKKISLGIPFYSYHWQPAYQDSLAHVWGDGLDWIEARGLADRFGAEWVWDNRQQVYSAVYENQGLNEYLFLEDGRSFKAKWEYAKKLGVRGISVWRLGHEDPAVWEFLKKELQ